LQIERKEMFISLDEFVEFLEEEMGVIAFGVCHRECRSIYQARTEKNKEFKWICVLTS
jgi:hypothetical protein